MQYICALLACLVLASCVSLKEQQRLQRHQAYQSDMNSRMGQPVTLSGRLIYLKKGWWVCVGDRADNNGVVLRGVRYKDLEHLYDHVVTVSGTLQQFKSGPPDYFLQLPEATLSETQGSEPPRGNAQAERF